MAKTKKKKDDNTLEITNDPGSTITTVTRAELQTKLDHKQLDKAAIQLDIDEYQSDLAILDEE